MKFETVEIGYKRDYKIIEDFVEAAKYSIRKNSENNNKGILKKIEKQLEYLTELVFTLADKILTSEQKLEFLNSIYWKVEWKISGE